MAGESYAFQSTAGIFLKKLIFYIKFTSYYTTERQPIYIVNSINIARIEKKLVVNFTLSNKS